MTAVFQKVPPIQAFMHWIDNHYQGERIKQQGLGDDPTWTFPVSFALIVLSPLSLFWVGWSPVAVGVAVALYWVRMFGITGVYHRYFSHRTYKTSRWFQFFLALLGNASGQRGPLWWAAHHRLHHKHSDQPEDAHSPVQGGFWNSHVLWWGRNRHIPTHLDQIKDFAKYPELMFLDRFDSIVPLTLGALCYGMGAILEAYAPQLGTNGLQMLAWGFGISTLVLFNGVAVINSLAHVIGRKRFDSGDESRNSLMLAIVTMGEGWHNNHHYYANATRQGFYWWQWDPTYYILWGMSKVGLVWDLKPVPERVMQLGRKGRVGGQKSSSVKIRPVEPGVEAILGSTQLSPALPDIGKETQGRELTIANNGRTEE